MGGWSISAEAVEMICKEYGIEDKLEFTERISMICSVLFAGDDDEK